jgi:hypothetical protein
MAGKMAGGILASVSVGDSALLGQHANDPADQILGVSGNPDFPSGS